MGIERDARAGSVQSASEMTCVGCNMALAGAECVRVVLVYGSN